MTARDVRALRDISVQLGSVRFTVERLAGPGLSKLSPFFAQVGRTLWDIAERNEEREELVNGK